MKVTTSIFVGLEAILLAGQITTLVSTYWTSWELKFNYTLMAKRSNGRPLPDGQLVSEGHAGLWSRCIKVYRNQEGTNSSSIISEACFHNYEGQNITFTFGKICKIATAALCVGEVAVTVLILIIALIMISWSRALKHLRRVPMPILLTQGIIYFTIPVIYISGNMAETIEQLSATHSTLLIVDMGAGYAHDWAFWGQMILTIFWLFAVGTYMIFYIDLYGLTATPYNTSNGKKQGSPETAEMQPLNK